MHGFSAPPPGPTDTANNTICATTTSFSPFAVFEINVPVKLTRELIADVRALNLARGPENSLLDKLEAATHRMDAGANKTAINILNDFIKQVQNQRGKKIAEAAADALIDSAKQIITLLQE